MVACGYQINAGGALMGSDRLGHWIKPIFFVLLTTPCLAAEPAVGWRFDGSGRYEAAEPPREWSAEKNVLWKSSPLGRSISTPVVLSNRVFTTADPAELVCLRSSDGQVLWQRSHTYADALGMEKADQIAADHRQAEALRKEVYELHREREERKKAGGDRDALKALDEKIAEREGRIRTLHAYPPIPGGDTGNSASTPITDGQAVYAVFGTGIVSAHTLNGQRRWMKFIAAPTGNHSASPLLADGRLIVSLGELIALDPATGDVVWRAKVPERHGTPVAARVGDGSVIVTPDGAVVRVSDGRVLAKDQFRLGYCSPIVAESVVYAAQEGTIKALKLPESSVEPSALETLWESKGARTNRLASPVVHEGLLYTVTEQGILEAFDAATGAAVYQKRLALRRGRTDPSLCVAGGLLFVSSNDGTTVAVRPGREFAELSSSRLEEFVGTPTFDGPRLFIRTKQYCLAEGP
jgi:outer membrane protein assembly factor BamB